MNNYFSYYKFLWKFILFFTFLFSYFGVVDAATIESTTTGGNWYSPTTWVGGVVPTSNDTAIVNSSIVFSSNITAGNLEIKNNGSIRKISSNYKYTFNVLGETINNGTIGGVRDGYSENVRFNFNGGLINNGYIYGVNELYLKISLENTGNIDQNIYLSGNTNIYGSFNYGKTIILNGYTLYAPNNAYIYAISGLGNLYSSTSLTGDNENIYLGVNGGLLNTNFEFLNLSEKINSINGRNIIIGGNIKVFSTTAITINGNLIIDEGARLTKKDSLYNYNIYLNGNFENNGSYGGDLFNYGNSSKIYIRGNMKNKGTIENPGHLYIYGGIDNIEGNVINGGIYVSWDYVSGYSYYDVEIEGIGIYKSSGTNYGLSSSVLNLDNLYWRWRPYVSGINNYEWSEHKCINVPGCIPNLLTNNNGPIEFNPNDVINNNSNPICSQNISSGENIFDISKLTIKTDETESLTTISEDSSKGDPVILSTGEFDYENTLISYTGNNLPFEFKIKYKNKSFYNGPIGNNFDFNYNIYLTQDIDGNINLHDGKLGVYNFYKNGSSYTRNDYIKANLELINDKYQITFDDKSKYIFGDNFKIQKLEDTFGNNLSFEYNTDLQLTKIIDTLNREYTFSYYANSRIYKITDFLGKETEFIYFGENETEGSQFDLKTIKMYSGISEKEISFTYTIGTDFESSHNIVKLIDSANNTYVENTYDNLDRVSSQIYGNGTINYNYTVDTNNKITKNSVTDREGNVIDYYYDSFGNTIKKVIKKTSGDLEYNYEYDSNNNLIKETKPLGNGDLYNYDVNNNIIEKRLVQDTTSSGSINDIVINYTYDLNTNKPTQIIEPNGLITNLVYDTNNNLVSKEVIGVKDYDGTDISINESFTYNGSGQLVSQTNALGLQTSFEYTAGNLTKITKGTGSLAIENNFVYDTRGNIVKIIDGKLNETNLSYNDFNLLINKTTSEGIVNEIIYNSLNKKTSEKIVLGANDSLDTSYNYDILDNLTQSISEVDYGVNLITNYTYDTNSRIIETSTGSGAVESYNYDENGLILSKTITYGNNNVTTSYTYDLNERLIKQINPNNSEVNFEYDLFDRIIKKIEVNGSYTIYTYDKSNNITKQEIYSSNDVLIGKQEFVYDKQNRVIETKNHKLPNDIIISKTKYDSLGNTIKTIDGKGNEVNYSYDIFSRLIQLQDELGNIVQNSYDKNDNLIEKKIISSTNKTITTNYTYDSDNRLVSETNSLNKTKTYTYKKLNQVISITDEKGNITNYTYTYTGKVKTETKVTNSGNLTTSYTYDNMGNMTSVTDSEGNITNYEYDSLNRLVKQIYADEKEVNYTYDTNNNLVQKTDPNGTIINYTYDSQNRLISKNITNGNGVVGITSETYSYDALGRMIEANDSNNHKLEFSYDSLGRMITETQSGSLVSYDYDNNNNLTSINDVSYTYDNLNRITNIGYNSNNVATYNYIGLENTSIIYANNTSIIKTFDNLSRINSLDNGVNTYNYTYDDVNNITSDSIKNYLYDDIYRLTNVNETNSGTLLESFNYDDVGNRINSFNINTGSGANYDYETNILNQYTSLSGSISSYELQEIIEEIQTGSGETQIITTYTGSLVTTNENTSFVYDDNGNLKNNGTFEFSYDYKNRLTKVETSSGIIAQYSYDVLNRRYLKELENERVEYIYSNENILSENITDLVNQTTTTKNYINGIGLDDLVAYEENNDIYYYHKNHLGSVEGITDNMGNIVISYDYDSFGNAKITSGTDNGNTRLYTGREYNSEIGLYYNRARYYNPELGRFISRDPIDISDDVNLYTYVGNNGVNFVDRSGLSKVLIFVAKDKTFMGLTYSTLETSKNILVNNYLEKGFKEENIHIVFGNTLKDFTDSLILNEYKEIGLVAHSNSDGIDLDASIENSSAIIVDNNLSKLPILNNDTILTIIGCHAGNGNNSIAQKISNQMRIEVLATENFINNDGEKFINGGSSGWNTLYYGLRQFDAEFLTFKPE